MRYREVIELLNKNPDYVIECKSLEVHEQTASSLLYWQTSPKVSPAIRRKNRRDFRLAKDWTISEGYKTIAGWARLDKYGCIVSLHPTRYHAEHKDCRTAKLYLGEIDTD